MDESVLHLSPYAVSPPTYGGQLRTHNICAQVSRHYRVDLFCQQVGREDLDWTLSPVVKEVLPNYIEYCPRDPISVLVYGACAYLGCPVFPQSDILRLTAPSWLRERIAAAAVINVEHPWQFKWVHRQIDARKPLVLTAHNVEAELTPRVRAGVPQWLAASIRKEALRREAFAMRHAWRIFTMSEENSKVIVDTYQVPPERCVVIPNGVDCSQFVPVSDAERKARQSALGLADKFVILFSGSTHGPNREAVKQILAWAEEWPDDRMRFLVAGSVGSAFTHISHPRVIFSGPVDDILPYFQAADVAINPLLSGSGTTLKQVEYMAMGLPTVATPIGARGIRMRDGDEGYVRNASDILQQLRWLMSESQMRTAVGRNARRFVERQFDWSVIGARVVDIYRELECAHGFESVSGDVQRAAQLRQRGDVLNAGSIARS